MTIRIGNAAGFSGDNLDAPRLLAESGELDFLTLEYLAELTLSVLAYQKKKNPHAGYVADLLPVVESLIPSIRQQRNLKVVTNGGGMNPRAAVERVSELLVQEGLPDYPIALCEGDDLSERFEQLVKAGERWKHLETGESFTHHAEFASANAYLGAAGIVEALNADARMVITGRIADASLTVGPAVHQFDWKWGDFERLGRATVAGHLIECGAQVTGGMFSHWNVDQFGLANIGYPIACLDEDGNCEITKATGTDGAVTVATVAEQLVYEIGDPKKYLTPDVTADFHNVQLEQLAPDRVRVIGGCGTAAPDRYKVSLAYHDGFAVSGMIVFAGRNAAKHARQAGAMIRKRMERAGWKLDRFFAEVIGAGDLFLGNESMTSDFEKVDSWEVVLRVSGQDARREAIDRLAREIAPLVTSGPPGATGYTGSRPRSRPVLAYWPTTIAREKVDSEVSVRTATEWISDG